MTYYRTMIDNAKFMEDYSRGMELLYASNRPFGNLAMSLGYPIANESIPTAQVQINLIEERVEFVMNPDFIAKLSNSELAAVISHELYHVLLNHLEEMKDKENFKDTAVLIDAHECIINDTLPMSTGFSTPKGTWRGPERHDQDFSNFTTQEAYDFILNKPKDEDQSSDDSDEKSDSSEDGESSDEGSGGSGDGSEDSDGSSSEGSSDGQEAGDSSGSSSGDSTPQDSNGGGDGEPSGSCGGVVVTGDDPADMDALKKVLGKAVSDAMKATDTADLSPEIQNILEDLKDAGLDIPNVNYSSNVGRDGYTVIEPYSDLNVNWHKLLAEINPKMKTAGRKAPKASWHAPRRRMIHSYPNVILPTRREEPKPTGKGDSIPTFVIALDMSPSIPTSLLPILAAFAKSVPENLIRALPITWSSTHRIFDPERPREIVSRVGTLPRTIMSYVRSVEKETGTKPYVLVITDGGYSIPRDWDKDEIKSHWYWMGIEEGDTGGIKSTTGPWTSDERIFDIRKFI